MSTEHVTNLAERFGASEALIRRSAAARATAAGTSADEIVTAWAGGSVAAQPETVAPVKKVEAPVAPVISPPEAQPAVESQPARAEPAAQKTEEPMPALPVPPTATTEPIGRPSGFSPWIVAAFLVIPLFGLLYLVVNSNGVACGDGGRLAVAFDGSLVNCDGTAFEGGGGGEAEAAAFLAIGQEVYGTGAQCVSCHGVNGQGGTGPALSGGAVLVTWPTCDDHVKWITLGSDGWSVAVGSTYGAESKPVQSGMPGFETDLSDEEIRAVAAFERIRFGGAPAEETMIACGLIVPEEPTESIPVEP